MSSRYGLLDLLYAAGAKRLSVVFLRTTLNTPVKDVVVLVALTDEEVAEQFAQVRTIRLVVKAKSTSVIQEDSKFVRESSAKEVGGCGHLLLHDTVILLLLRGSLEALPGQSAAQKVHKDIGEGLEIISTGLLNAQVRVDGSVTSGTSQVLVLPVRNMKMCLGVAELLRKTEVDDVNLVATLANTGQYP